MRRTAVVGAALLGVVAGGCKFPDLPPIDDDAGIDAAASGVALRVDVVGTGTVSSIPSGIDCGAVCAVEFPPLASVALAAFPDATSVFEGWGGDCQGTGDCELTMDSAKAVTATFADHGAVRWLEHLVFAGDELDFAVTVDAQGDVIVAGTVDDGSGWDLFVAKYAPTDGAVRWMRHLDTPDPNGETFGAVATDPQGNVYVVARLQGDGSVATYDTHGAVGDPFGNVLVLRLAASTGAVDWAKSWGGTALMQAGPSRSRART